MSNELRDTIAQAIEPHIPQDGYEHVSATVRMQWAYAQADDVLAALQTAGYTIVRPVTAEEEAANVW